MTKTAGRRKQEDIQSNVGKGRITKKNGNEEIIINMINVLIECNIWKRRVFQEITRTWLYKFNPHSKPASGGKLVHLSCMPNTMESKEEEAARRVYGLL